MLSMIATLLIFAVFFAYFIWRLIQRGYETRALAERGVPVTGEVVHKMTHRSQGHSIRTRHPRYRFHTPDSIERGISGYPEFMGQAGDVTQATLRL